MSRKLKQFEVKVFYSGTLTYMIKATCQDQATQKAQKKNADGAEPDQLMTDWEYVDKIETKPL